MAAMLGLVVAGLAYSTFAVRERHWLAASLAYDGQQWAGAIHRQVSVNLETVDALSAFFRGSRQVEPEGFRAFTEVLLQSHPGIMALGWAPQVASTQRDKFEQAAREELRRDFHIRPVGWQGQPAAADARGPSFPVYFLEPTSCPVLPVGGDLASDLACLEAIRQATDGGQKAATGRLFRGDHGGGQCELLVVAPVYRRGMPHATLDERRANLAGVVFALLCVGVVVEEAFQPDSPRALDTHLFDLTSAERPELLYARPCPRPGEPFVALEVPPDRSAGGRFHAVELDVAGRRWMIVVTPTSQYVAEHWSWLPAAVLVASILIAALVGMYFLLLAGQTGRVEQLVNQRTVELQRINAALAQEIVERKRAEEALREEQDRLQHMLDLLERDRKLVAYEIHDGFVQLVVGAQMLLQAYRQQQAVDPEEANETFDAGLQLLAEGIVEARHLIGGLRPPFLDEAGVVAAVEYLVGEASRRGGPRIEFVHDLQTERLDPRLEVAIFRILQESLNNALAHSRSDRVRLALVQAGNSLRIEVEDWGVGFDPAQVKPDRFGLEGIRERARLFGGQLVLDTAPGKGTRIVVELPLGGEHEPLDAPVCCASA